MLVADGMLPGPILINTKLMASLHLRVRAAALELPVCGQVLLYRKHVITGQPYIAQLVRVLEAGGVRPVPIFINGIEAHTIVRDQLTTAHERKAGRASGTAPQRGAIEVDAIVSTIGFPVRRLPRLTIVFLIEERFCVWALHRALYRLWSCNDGSSSTSCSK